MRPSRTAAGLLLGLASTAAAITPFNIFLRQALRDAASPPRITTLSGTERPSYNLSVPVDHFHNDSSYEPHSDGSFNLRYWFDASHYAPGGPVIILAAGETTAAARLPFLEHGILRTLSEATRGVAVVLEHRYYGTSFPVDDLSTPNMRFLTTDQALADTAYFAKHVQFPGLERERLNPPHTPYVIYGGSYAGAFAAFARKLYPDVFWGAISSSGVTAAIFDYWEYFEAARLFSPGDCAERHQAVIRVVDSVLLSGDYDRIRDFKLLFGLDADSLPRDVDFAELLSIPVSMLQATNWDPSLDEFEYGSYCGAVSSSALLYGSTRHLLPAVRKVVAAAGFVAAEEKESAVFGVLNFIGYMRGLLKRYNGGDDDGGNFVATREAALQKTGLETWPYRSWAYQTCTQWGYFVSGTGVPAHQLPMISRAITLEHAHAHCPLAFNITPSADIVDSVNKLGGLNFSFPRVAIVDGSRDPWRQATPHRLGLPDRESTIEEPFLMLDFGVHHWDENGLAENASEPNLPPPEIVETQHQEVVFVKAWLEEFRAQRKTEDVDEWSNEL